MSLGGLHFSEGKEGGDQERGEVARRNWEEKREGKLRSGCNRGEKNGDKGTIK